MFDNENIHSLIECRFFPLTETRVDKQIPSHLPPNFLIGVERSQLDLQVINWKLLSTSESIETSPWLEIIRHILMLTKHGEK